MRIIRSQESELPRTATLQKDYKTFLDAIPDSPGNDPRFLDRLNRRKVSECKYYPDQYGNIYSRKIFYFVSFSTAGWVYQCH